MSDNLYTRSAVDEQIRHRKKQTSEKKSFSKAQYSLKIRHLKTRRDSRRMNTRPLLYLDDAVFRGFGSKLLCKNLQKKLVYSSSTILCTWN